MERAHKKIKRYTNRTSVILDDKQTEYLKKEAQKHKVSMGDVIRSLINEAIITNKDSK